MVANGNGHTRVLREGVWAPIPTFYDDNEEIDFAPFSKHVVTLAKAGMQPVVCGSMGEAFHLTGDERLALFSAARKALDEAGLNDTVLIAGTGANSTRETIRLCKAAAETGAVDATIVIPPGYFAGAMSKAALKTFFVEVAAASPLPVMMYNFPGAAGGIDMDSDLVGEIAREAPNICGIKLTCGAVGKLGRITGQTATPNFKKQFPRQSSSSAPDFVTLGGFADFLAPTVAGGRAHGAIMGLGNIYPKSIAKLMGLALDARTNPAVLAEALDLQDLVSEADACFARAGIAGTKWYLQKHNGYPSRRMRRPLLDFTDAQGEALEKESGVTRLMEVEKSL